MQSLPAIRAGKPPWYPDQSIHAEYASRIFGLGFAEIDGGTGLAFIVSSTQRSMAFGAGRGSFFPQNPATAATLANDKYLAGIVMERAGIPTLGGAYFFLHERHRAHRPPGHERSDARTYFRTLGSSAFLKPLAGSRGDFAQAVTGDASLMHYLDQVSRYHDAVLMQRIFAGNEYRIVLLDDDVIYCARKTPPVLTGDGRHSLRELLARRDEALNDRGISSTAVTFGTSDDADTVLPVGTRLQLTGRTNRSAGGAMSFETPRDDARVFDLARRAAKALGLRAAAIDLFTDIGGDAGDMRIIEANANPSIRFLEDSNRDDLILKIWHHTFTSAGLLNV